MRATQITFATEGTEITEGKPIDLDLQISFSHGLNMDETRIFTVGSFLPWDNSIEKQEENSGTLIYANLH